MFKHDFNLNELLNVWNFIFSFEWYYKNCFFLFQHTFFFFFFFIISTTRWCFLPTTSSILDGHKGEGGVSRRSGGRDERPPHLSIPGDYLSSKNRWIPPNTIKRDVNSNRDRNDGVLRTVRGWNPPSVKQRDGLSTEEKNDLIFRKARGILNKLTPEKFDKLSLELLNVGIDSQLILKGIILLIFEKALDEPKYSSLYAQLCHRLCEDAPNFEHPSSNTTTFRRLLLNKCRDEFENRSRATEAYDKKDVPLNDDEAEQYHLAKQKMLGNIKFIGELGKLEMLHEGILHKCIKQLLEKKKNVPVKDMAEDLECLCQIIRTVGRRLDTAKAKAWMDQYFERIKNFATNPELPSRIRFMLQDVVELRANRWVPRKVLSDHGPKTISQIRQEAADEYGVYIAPPDLSGRVPGGAGTGNMFGSRMLNGNFGPGQRGGLGDIFSASPTGLPNSIGTGPGVIQLDSFVPGYSLNMGRRGSQPNPGSYQNQYSNRRLQPEGGIGGNSGGVGGSGSSPRSSRRGNSQQSLQQNPLQSQQIYQLQQNHQSTQMSNMQPSLLAQPSQLPLQAQRLQGTGGSRDLPPRFVRMTIQPPTGPEKTNSNTEEISLRPSKNFNVFRPTVPNMLPKSARGGPPSIGSQQTGFQSPILDIGSATASHLLTKPPQITIKQANPDKTKTVKKTPPTKKELENSMTALLDDYFNSGDIPTAVSAFRDLNAPNKYIADVIYKMMINNIDKTDSDREKVMNLLCAMKPENLLTSENFMDAYRRLLEKLPELETDIPLVKSYAASYAAQAIAENVVCLADLAESLEHGAHYPLFLICLQQMHKQKDKDWLVNIFTDSKINLQDMLPEIDQNKEKMMEILEDRGLSFLFPLLRIQSELWKQIQTDPSATAIFKWIKDKVQNDLHYSPGFVNILTTSILKYVTKSSTLSENCDPNIVPDKLLSEKEKDLLDKLKVVLQRFLQDQIGLQVSALYASQVFCYNCHFPKNMLRRFFMNFYDMEIIEEEAFLKWKEDINDEYPGKGKALFQVNQWLTWLEQAEEESEDDDDED